MLLCVFLQSKPTYLDGTMQRLLRILWQRGFSQGLPLPASAPAPTPASVESGNTSSRYVSSHVHTHSQPNSDAASYFTQHNTMLCNTDPGRPAAAAYATHPVLDKFTSLANSPASTCRSPPVQQSSASPSTAPPSRSALPTPTVRQPVHIDHVFVPPESSALAGSASYNFSLSNTQYGMSNATSSYSMADTGATGRSSFATGRNPSELTYDLVVGSPADPKQLLNGPLSACSKPDSVEFSKKCPPDYDDAARRCDVPLNVDLCELVTWSCENVAAWLESQGVADESRALLREIDGGLLFELAVMQKEAPQFLYEALRTDFHLPLLSLLRVVRALRRLNSPSNLLNHY